METKCIALFCALGAVVCDAAVVKEYRRIDGNETAPLPGKTLHPDMFADASLWLAPNADSNYGNKIGIAREGGRLTLNGTKSEKSKDTAWYVKTKALPLSAKGLGYVLSFWLDSNMVLQCSRLA